MAGMAADSHRVQHRSGLARCGNLLPNVQFRFGGLVMHASMFKKQPVVLIDGRAGAGKTSLAAFLADEIQARYLVTVQLIHMDDLTEGWKGLASASAQVARIIKQGTWQRYDWISGTLVEHHQIKPGLPLIIEGCGAISKASADLADFRIWVECDDDLRRERAIARDGALFEPHWETWADQEQQIIKTQSPKAHADLVWRSESDKLAECSNSLFLSLDQVAT